MKNGDARAIVGDTPPDDRSKYIDDFKNKNDQVIVQEFISNVVKHAQASEIKLFLRDSTKAFLVVLADNGIGFNVREIRKGMGINNIETRLNSIEATWKWKSDSKRGTRLIILISNQ